jgi:DNA-binding response OmpR family regulator
MPHDSKPDNTSVDDDAIAALRAALLVYIARPADIEQLRVALRTMTSAARQQGVLPEKVLITLKDVWYSVPAARALSEPDDQVRLLQRVVTMCIKEYYAE